MLAHTLARRTLVRSAALPLALAACGAPGAETVGAGKPALRSGVELVWSVGGSAGSARETMRRQMVATFNAEHPGITVELLFGHTGPEKLFTLFAGGTPPDLFRVSTQPYPAFVDQADAVHAGNLDVRDDEVQRRQRSMLRRFASVGRPKHSRTDGRKRRRDRMAQRRVVIHDEHGGSDGRAARAVRALQHASAALHGA